VGTVGYCTWKILVFNIGQKFLVAPFVILVTTLTLAACESVDIEAAVHRSTPIDSEVLPVDVRLAAAVAMAMKGYGPSEAQGGLLSPMG